MATDDNTLPLNRTDSRILHDLIAVFTENRFWKLYAKNDRHDPTINPFPSRNSVATGCAAKRADSNLSRGVPPYVVTGRCPFHPFSVAMSRVASSPFTFLLLFVLFFFFFLSLFYVRYSHFLLHVARLRQEGNCPTFLDPIKFVISLVNYVLTLSSLSENQPRYNRVYIYVCMYIFISVVQFSRNHLSFLFLPAIYKNDAETRTRCDVQDVQDVLNTFVEHVWRG